MKTMWTLFLIFITLKLAGLVEWNWWFVTMPLTIPFLLIMLLSTFIDKNEFKKFVAMRKLKEQQERMKK